MSNEELAAAIRAGEQGKITELWAQVRRFALWRARRWAAFGRGCHCGRPGARGVYSTPGRAGAVEGGGRALSLDAPLNDDPDADTLEAVTETYRRYFR